MSAEETEGYIKDGANELSRRADKETERNRKGKFTLVFMTEQGERVSEIKAHLKLKDIDFRFGANIFMLGEYDEERSNKAYAEKFLSLLNTATVPLYWEGTEPKRGHLRYDASTPHDIYRRPAAGYVADFCEKNKLHMKGHVLLWHEFVPAWLPENYCDIKPLIAKRFREISERYADRIEMFDVVNEPSRIYDVYMRDRGRSNTFFVPDDDYALRAFHLARNLFPTNKLIMNDTVGASFHEFRGVYSGYYLNLKDMLSRGAEIDEIGLQCHLGDTGGENVYNAERFYNVLDTYASLGKTINISEISIPSEFGGKADEDLQAEAAVQLYRAAFSHPAVTGITWWNLTDDGVSAVKRKAGDENMPSTGLVKEGFAEKKAYKKLKKLIKEDWQSEITAETNDNTITFNGFYGTYEAEVFVNGKKYLTEIRLPKNGIHTQRVVLH